MKTIIYSCVTGKYDNVLSVLLQSKPIVGKDTELILFSDRPGLVESEVYRQVGSHVEWSVRPLVWRHPTCNIRTARWHKINSHLSLPEHDYSIWVDGSQRIKPVDLQLEVVEPFQQNEKKQPIATFKHPVRTCVYQEMSACNRLRKDNATLMSEQVKKYRSEDYPPYNGMVETACVVRNNSLPVRRFNDFWWNEIENGSRRDQLSFNYTSWKLEVAYGRVMGHRAESAYFEFVPHKGK